MSAQDPLARAAKTLRTYDAIGHDLTIRPSDVLAARHAQIEAEILELTGATSVAEARHRIERARRRPNPAPPKQRAPERSKPRSATPKPRAPKKKWPPHGSDYVRGQDDNRSTRRGNRGKRTAPAGRLIPVTGVVSAGLPGSSRRH